jgi:hypothetical protein
LPPPPVLQLQVGVVSFVGVVPDTLGAVGAVLSIFSENVTSLIETVLLSHVLQVAELEVQEVPFEEVSTVAVLLVPLSIEPVMVKNLLFP